MKGYRLRVVCLLLFTWSISSVAQTRAAQPIDRTQLMAWLTANLSSARLQRLVTERGAAFSLDPSYRKQLGAAGADPALIQSLQKLPHEPR